MSLAQQSEPTTTPRENLPEPARIFATSDPLVLAPVASKTDDSRREPADPNRGRPVRGPLPGHRGAQRDLWIRDQHLAR